MREGKELKGKDSEPSKLLCVLSFPENFFLSVSDLDYKIPGAAIVFNLNLLQMAKSSMLNEQIKCR